MGEIIDINKNFTDCINELDRIQEASKQAGFVYILRLDNGIYKIGQSNNLGFRLGNYHLDNMRKGITNFYIYFIISTNAPTKLEKLLHENYDTKRVEGTTDHFRIAEEDIPEIRLISETSEFSPDFPKSKKIRVIPGSIEDFSNLEFGKKEELKAVVRILFGSRQSFLTIEDIQERMPVKNCEETIRRSLYRNELRKYIEIQDSSYKLNRTFWDEFNKKIFYADLTCDMILVPETDEDRKRLDAAGMAHCPSCGNPTNKSDIFQLKDGGYCCLTEYVQAAFRLEKCKKMKDGSISVRVKGLPDISATGSTRDQYREDLIQAIRAWIIKQQQEGGAIPDIRKIKKIIQLGFLIVS